MTASKISPIFTSPSVISNGTFDVEFSQGSYNEGLYSGPVSYQVPLYNGSTDVIAQPAVEATRTTTEAWTSLHSPLRARERLHLPQ